MLNTLPISELTARLAQRQASSREILQSCLDQIVRVDDRVHAFLSYDAADAFAQADAADKLIASGTTHAEKPLLGVPIALKDVLAVKDQPLGCASKILEKFISPYDATVVEKLRPAQSR
jgi:aspartyl-tRNA(Asn)/glutamyl-tRNA(Gln) amidotransferase subunit A